jgi:hypothetical protein
MNDTVRNFDTGIKKFDKSVLCIVIPVLFTAIIITLLVLWYIVGVVELYLICLLLFIPPTGNNVTKWQIVWCHKKRLFISF